MKGDLGFFGLLLPSGASEVLTIRGLQVEPQAGGHVRFQLLVMQTGKTLPEFKTCATRCLKFTRAPPLMVNCGR